MDKITSIYALGAAFRMKSKSPYNGTDWDNAVPIPNKPGIFIYEDQVWVLNHSICGLVCMRITGTVFAPVMMCDLVLFVPLLSLVVAAVLGAVALVCGRGGRGYPTDTIRSSWIYVYPIIIASGIMTILSFIVMNLVSKGLYTFCQQFEHYTGKSRCTTLMDHFTVQQMGGLRHFFLDHELCKYSYTLVAVLWLAQLLVTCTRVVRAEDFRFNQVIVRRKDEHSHGDEKEEEIWDKISAPKLYIVEDSPKKATKSK